MNAATHPSARCRTSATIPSTKAPQFTTPVTCKAIASSNTHMMARGLNETVGAYTKCELPEFFAASSAARLIYHCASFTAAFTAGRLAFAAALAFWVMDVRAAWACAAAWRNCSAGDNCARRRARVRAAGAAALAGGA